MKTRVLISGARGQLMTDLIEEIDANNYSNDFLVSSHGRDTFDVTNKVQVETLFDCFKPHVYIHGASVHNAAEIEEDPTEAFNVNVRSLCNISKIANKYNTTVINFSTDYVFNMKMGYYAHENTPRNPVNTYGFTKSVGEITLETFCDNFANVRVCGLFGRTGSRAKNNTNFVMNMFNKIKNDEKIEVVDDQLVTVGYTRDISRSVIYDLIIKKLWNNEKMNESYHIFNSGVLSWYELAVFVQDFMGKSGLVIPVESDKFYSNFKRPKCSALINNKLPPLPNWKSAVIRYIENDILGQVEI